MKKQDFMSKHFRGGGPYSYSQMSSDLDAVITDNLLPDIRNKLSPLKNLIAMIENGLLTGTVDAHHLITNEIEQCKKSIEYISNLPKTDVVIAGDGGEAEQMVVNCPICNNRWNLTLHNSCQCGAQLKLMDCG